MNTLKNQIKEKEEKYNRFKKDIQNEMKLMNYIFLIFLFKLFLNNSVLKKNG